LRDEALVISGEAQLRAGGGAPGHQSYPHRLPTPSNALTVRNADSAAVAQGLHSPRWQELQWAFRCSKDIIATPKPPKQDGTTCGGFIPGGYHTDRLPGRYDREEHRIQLRFAAFLLALVVRSAVFPLAPEADHVFPPDVAASPASREIKERYCGQHNRAEREDDELYKEYGINPFSGCGSGPDPRCRSSYHLYQCMLHYQFEFTKGHFLWINPAASASTPWIPRRRTSVRTTTSLS